MRPDFTSVQHPFHCLQAAASEHWLQRLMQHWRLATHERKQERAATIRAAFISQKLQLRRGWRAWLQAVRDKRQRRQVKQLAEHFRRSRLLANGWSGWLEWTALCRSARQRQVARTQAAVLKAWRSAVKVADRRCGRSRLLRGPAVPQCMPGTAFNVASGCLLFLRLNIRHFWSHPFSQAAG